MKNIELKTGQDLLHYLYNHQMREGANLMGLLGVADQYDMQELKTWCAKLLAMSVTKANRMELLYVAELYAIPILKKAVLGYRYIPDQVEHHGT
jgi:BTB/POZ domain